MEFESYTDLSVRTAADLVNTLGSVTETEYLETAEDLRRFLREHHMQAPRSISEKDLEEVRALRARLRAVFEANPKERARLLNDLIEEAGTLPQISNHDGQWHFHYVPMDAPIATRIAAGAAMGIGVVVTEFGQDRLGICSADRCRDVFVDTSRNRSRRYCDDQCGTRMGVAAFRARQKAGR